MSERKEGWYWVKRSKAPNCPYSPELWTGDYWACGLPINEIGPRIPAPDQVSWHVPTLKRVRDLCDGATMVQLRNIIDGMLETDMPGGAT